MHVKTIIYTTNKSLWVKSHFKAIYEIIKKAKGLTFETFTVKYMSLPSVVPTYVNGGTYIRWDWMKTNCPAEGHNAVCLHISRYERDRLGLKHPNPNKELGGVYNRDSDAVFDFVVIADKNGTSYDDMTSFVRIFCHELSHGFSHWRGVFDYTHLFDYTLKNMKGIFLTHDFTAWNKLHAQVLSLILQLQGMIENFNPKNPPDHHEEGEVVDEPVNLFILSLQSLGSDVSPNDLVPDEFGCAETVSMLIRKFISFPIITGTWTLWEKLKNDDRFEAIGEPEPGAIIISPTGMGNGTIPGHVGICGFEGEIMSNDSYTGTFKKNFTEESWKTRYMKNGGFPIYYYRLRQ